MWIYHSLTENSIHCAADRNFMILFATFAKCQRQPNSSSITLMLRQLQDQLEECVLKIARQLHERTKEDYLVISGGVALNSVTNGRLVRESGLEDLYVMPAAGDNGTAIGAAYYVYHSKLGHPRTYVHDNPFVGTEYPDVYRSKHP